MQSIYMVIRTTFFHDVNVESNVQAFADKAQAEEYATKSQASENAWSTIEEIEYGDVPAFSVVEVPFQG